MDKNSIVGFFLAGNYVFDNFSPFQVEWRGKLYPTTEHAYQAAHFINTAPELADTIRLSKSPREASDFANAHSSREDPEWRAKRLTFMEEIVRCKLEQHKYIREALLKTGTKYIVEMNDDAFWGWGKDHNGENNLGKIWMKLRDELRASIYKL